jgi:asparagine synthase (glutamine-hydrolysing)
MCGIAGIVRWADSPVDPNEIEAMMGRMAHRGPDDDGCYLAGGIALGHRRLAVIDPENGRQPLFNEDGGVGVSFNGAIYNHRELRSELERAGHHFRTHCDTEVIVHGWEEWGADCVQRFRGMFAFGLVDWNRREVFLARDRFGIKPMVYSLDGRELVFGSTIAAVRAGTGRPAEIDLDAVGEYLEAGYISAPRTIFRSIQKLPEAHSLLLDFDGRTRGPQRYWGLRPQADLAPSAEDWIAELTETLHESVRAHLIADVPVGAFLSGGVDSSLLVSLMSQCGASPVKTYSVGFADDPSRETAYAETVAERWRTDHCALEAGPELIDRLPRLLAQLGEPLADWAALPLALLSERAKQEVVVCISGDGGDELFAGYQSYWKWLDSLQRRGLSRLEAWMEARAHLQRPEEVEALWRPELQRAYEPPGPILQAMDDSVDFSLLEQALHADRRTYLPSGLLLKADAASMMHGLEVRTPILDQRVAELACRMPFDRKRGPGAYGEQTSKLALRQALAQYFPDEFVYRPKQGFTPPIRTWLRTDPKLRAEVSSSLTRRGARIHEFLDPAAVGSLVDSIPTLEWVEPVWALWTLEVWLAGAESAPENLY